jgi:prevent-host-death family protein
VSTATIRDLRNKGGEVIRRAAAGETITITRDGTPVAELRPIPKPGISSAEVLARWNRLPAMDPQKLRDDLDAIVDPSP